MVGQAGFEPTTSSSRTRRATNLRHCPCCRTASLPALGGRRERFVDRSQGVEGTERFDHPAVGGSSAGQEDIGFTVEQQIDDARVEATRLLLLADRQTCGYAPHIADLKIKQHKIGLDLGNGRYDVGAVAHPVYQVGAPDRGLDVVDQPISVGGEKDVGHSPNRTRRRRLP